MNSRSGKKQADDGWSSSSKDSSWSSSSKDSTWTSSSGWNDHEDNWNSTRTSDKEDSWSTRTSDRDDSWSKGSDAWGTSSDNLVSSNGWEQPSGNRGIKRSSHSIKDINPRIVLGAVVTLLIIAVLCLVINNADSLSAFLERLISAITSSAVTALIIVAIIYYVLKAIKINPPWKVIAFMYLIAFLAMLFGDYIPGINALVRIVLTIAIVIGIFCFMTSIGSKK